MTTFENVYVVIIDDDETSADVLTLLLRQLGVSYSVFSDGIDAISAAYELLSANVIFVDLDLPYLNGYEVLAQLRTIPELHNIPIVAHTCHLSQMTYARTAGFDCFIGKPLRASIFSNQLTRMLNKEPVWDIR